MTTALPAPATTTTEGQAPGRRAHPLPVVRVVSNEAAFLSLREAWNHLAEQGTGGVFMRHEWFEAAWQWRRADSSLAVLVFSRAGDVVGIAPFVVQTQRRKGFEWRTLAFLTVPDTQWCDVLARPEDAQQLAMALTEALRNKVVAWDVLKLGYLAEQSFTRGRWLPLLARRGLAARSRQTGLNQMVNLKQCWQTYYAGRSRKLKKNNNWVANRLAKVGGARLQWLAPQVNGEALSSEQLNQVTAQLVDLSAASWKWGTGLTLDEAGPGRFMRRLTQLAAAQGWLSIWFLHIDGRPVAMEVQLSYRGEVHALRADYDDSYGYLSPGSHLNWKLLEQLFNSGAVRYWLGQGKNAYKQQWAEGGDRVFEASAYNRSLVGLSCRAVDTWLRPLLRRLAAGFNAASLPCACGRGGRGPSMPSPGSCVPAP